MKMLWPLVLCAAAAACSPPPAGPTSDGGTDAGTCSDAAKTPANLVPNHGFECGDKGWSPQSGNLAADADARTGKQSARLVATAAGGRFATTAPIVTSTSGKTYCAVAYLKGTVANAQLSVLEDKGGTVVDHTFSTPVASTAWIRTPPSTNLEVRAATGSKLYVRLVMRTPNAQDTLLADDVDVWESADGLCKEPR